MAWFAVFYTDTGDLFSTGQSVASDAELLTGGDDGRQLEKKEYSFDIQNDPTKRWNKTIRDIEDFVPPKDKLAAEEFLGRLTATEREDIFDAARIPSPGNKALYAFLETTRISGVVDPNDPAVVAVVDEMETAGLIGPGRAAEVLA